MNNIKGKYVIIGIVMVCVLKQLIFQLTKSIQAAVKGNKRIELGKQNYDSDEFYIEKVIVEVLR